MLALRQHTDASTRAMLHTETMITAVPLLEKQRALYRVPRGMERFDAYLDLMANGHPERLPTLPLQTMNPMAREHVAQRLDEAIALGADGWLAEFAAELNVLLGKHPSPMPSLHLCWVVADDVMGGWTHRHLTDASLRFSQPRHLPEWVPLVFWASETILRDDFRRLAFAAVHRHIRKLQRGTPVTLQDHLEQEGAALAFAGHAVQLSLDELEYTTEVLRPHLHSTHFPTLFTCLYGDEVGAAVGYPALGLSRDAGFEWALQQASEAAGRG